MKKYGTLNGHYELNRVFSRVGWDLLAYLATIITSIFLQHFLFEFLYNNISSYRLLPDWQIHIISQSLVMIGYLACFFVFMIVLKDLPKYKAIEVKKLSIPKLILCFIIALGTIYICTMITVKISGLFGLILYHPKISFQVFQNKLDEPLNLFSLLNVMVPQGFQFNLNDLFDIILLIILKPILEEVIFRGVLINRLRIYGDKVCIFASAFAFALVQIFLLDVVSGFFLGLILGYITLKTGTIKYSIILHITLNGLNLAIAPLFGAITKYQYNSIIQAVHIAIIVLAVILFVINFRKIKLDKGEVEITQHNKIKMFIFNSGTLTFMSLSVITVAFMIISRTYIWF